MSQDSQVYIRTLYSRGHGCALWVPEPNDELPPDYLSTGTRIGDVGLIGPDGQFDFLFNVCLPEEDPINQYNGVPPEFEPLVWDGRCTKKKKFFRAQQPIASKDSAQFDLSVEANASAFGLPAGAGGGVGIQFSRENGAVVMPGLNGADRTNASNKAIFRTYACEHGASWYQWVNETLGRDTENGELYLITGFDKTNSYENAVVHSRATTKSCSLAFTTGGLGAEGRLRLSKTTGHEALFTSRCSSEETHQNQSLFVRGFRISVRQGILALLGSKVKVASTCKSPRSDVLGRSPGGTPFASSSMFSNRSSGGSWSLAGSPSPRTTPTSSVYDSDSDSDSCSSISSDDSTTSIEEDDFLPESRIYHPLVAINDYILITRKDANVVVTHDDDWISLLDRELDGEDMPNDSVLIARLENRMSITVSAGHATVNENVRLSDITTATAVALALPSEPVKGTGSNAGRPLLITDSAVQQAASVTCDGGTYRETEESPEHWGLPGPRPESLNSQTQPVCALRGHLSASDMGHLPIDDHPMTPLYPAGMYLKHGRGASHGVVQVTNDLHHELTRQSEPGVTGRTPPNGGAVRWVAPDPDHGSDSEKATIGSVSGLCHSCLQNSEVLHDEGTGI
ncbi:hypothetical protein AAF712_016292 [Marasmius tenuissimus]|uniref:Uncharacterized protein n=1 Tax=Marasmius tenuissimus TaxID=585030 RepID=A0ABR2Z7V6_9AGAR